MILSGAVALILAVIVPGAEAYQFYSDATNDQGGCAQCHTGFRDNGNYNSAAEYNGGPGSCTISDADCDPSNPCPPGEGLCGLPWNTSLHNAHLNNTDIATSCDNCHGGAGTAGRTVNLRSSLNAKDGVNAIACSGCHGRLEDANTVTQNGTGWGAGLRQHHFNAGAPADSNGEFCVTCHADADPANFTTAGEDTMPPWYGSVLNTNLDLNLEPCNPGGEENLAGLAIGLDNDGDLLYDTADPDCQDPCGNGIIDPGEDCDPNFPNTECCNPDCTFAGAGTACGDPNVTECDLADTCDGAGTCQINYEPAGTTCGDPSDTDCDNPDTCDGMGGCLPNYETAGFACGDPADTQCDNPDTCDDVGVCLINNESDGTTCDDSNACTANDTCGGGSCQPGTLDCSQPNCDGTVDPRCALGCSGETDPDAFCQAQDGLFCNGLETCNLSSDQCEAGPPPNCDDGVACTIDSCDEVNDQCVNAPDNTACDDGNVCTTDVCDPILGCQNTPNTDPCDDGDFCTENDVCGGGTCAGTPKNCDDGSFCTGIETCSPVDGSCVSPGDPCTGQTVCNEGTDSCDAVTCVDNDNDGYGDPGDPSCLNGGQRDCDDTNASVNLWTPTVTIFNLPRTWMLTATAKRSVPVTATTMIPRSIRAPRRSATAMTMTASAVFRQLNGITIMTPSSPVTATATTLM
jgi:hypothetical protein